MDRLLGLLLRTDIAAFHLKTLGADVGQGGAVFGGRVAVVEYGDIGRVVDVVADFGALLLAGADTVVDAGFLLLEQGDGGGATAYGLAAVALDSGGFLVIAFDGFGIGLGA